MNDDWHLAYLSLGSNIEPEMNLALAFSALRGRFGEVLFSPVYRTAAVGFEGADFLNAAAIVCTRLGPRELDAWLHACEDAQGRDRGGPRFSDRNIDIDLLLYDALVLEGPGHLRLPRPELKHAFVLRPLADIAPAVAIPGLGRTVMDAWRAHPEFGTPAEVVDLEPAG
ncbi:2-amino-4-hydroxy-6-hydroxymethyldihydropteridine diphosphokinase [Lysobacter pythonis]|uniref:2-amino-4-hydroxy-6-hydroxymethyldihydropteridine pyrophosphokinase n=1 Tax=Solilutibacter pythonis TaxID=2483112 RepID=A0A3M2HH33_9GAMM|nr:2-amino-4-hydroxy-6-hydroxymethyldihydropteridine diphosphokinase [Lysobacter pythonis]RMH89031.1 2-amino-4-hydroxy-6-hydroxymethyldihydropteridine diphosphokinase [Lysobacter pythonis]